MVLQSRIKSIYSNFIPNLQYQNGLYFVTVCRNQNCMQNQPILHTGLLYCVVVCMIFSGHG